MTTYLTQTEVNAAIQQTKADLFDLSKEIGIDSFFEIFDEYKPEDDDASPSWLIESLFGNQIFNDNIEQVLQYQISGEYILGVWKRARNRLNLIIDGSQRKQGLQAKWLRVKRAAFERDGYKCQICGSQKYLCGHHVKERAQYPELAYEISNIVTLCKSCHAKQHPGKENLILKRKGDKPDEAGGTNE